MYRPTLLLFLFFLTPLPLIAGENLQIMAVPSLMNSQMDPWYRTPSHITPKIFKSERIFPEQPFHLFVFFQGFAVDKKGEAHLTYDYEVFDPLGNPTRDRGKAITAFQGKVADPKVLLLSRSILKIFFPPSSPPGTYRIVIKGQDHQSQTSVIVRSSIDLVPFHRGAPFRSQEEFDHWRSGFYRNPEPERVITSILQFSRGNLSWLKENFGKAAFFRRILLDFPFLRKELRSLLPQSPGEDRFKILLGLALSGDNLPEEEQFSEKEQAFFRSVATLSFLPEEGEVITGETIDILWAEFFASGGYLPLYRLARALVHEKHRGTLEKLKSGELQWSEEVERNALLQALYQVTLLSFITHGKNHPLISHYIEYMLIHEKLSASVKKELGEILSAIGVSRQEPFEKRDGKILKI